MRPGDVRAFPFRGGRFFTLAALAAATLCFAVAPAAATVRVELKFEAPTITQRPDGSVFVAAPECMTFNEPGLPMLPARRAVVLLPPGETVTAIRVRTQGLHEIGGAYLVAPAQMPQPISLPGPFPLTEPDPRVYGSNEVYPSAASRLVIEQKGWGHGLAFLRVFPVSYRPLSGRLAWHERVIVEVDTALPKGGSADTIPRLRNSERALDRLSQLVVNPQDLALYESAEPALLIESQLKPDYYPYVIVTRDKFVSDFEPVAAFQSSRGLRARIMTVEDIRERYPEGRDVPESIRMFLIDAYENWGAEFVLLGGDAEEVAPRSLYTEIVYSDGSIEKEWIPADCYYEGLDGTWNTDGDAFWGEPGEEDLVGEIAVGRVPASSLITIDAWRHKNEMYTEHPVVSQVKKALFLGEILWDDPYTSGDEEMDELQYGADTCGFTTAGYPADWDRQTLYDRDGIWDKLDLIPLINEGFPAVHHSGHSAAFYNMRMYTADLAYLTNDGVTSSYMLNNSNGCYAGAFDRGTSICEALVTDVHGSAASVCNSRYGKFYPGTTCGPSAYIQREFVDARYGEGIITAGRMNVDSKADLVWMLYDVSRYIHYEVTLFGDPAIPHWGGVLGELDLQHPGKYVIGQGSLQVTVNAGGVPVPGATVTLYSADFSVWTSGETDESGVVLLDPNVTKPMTLYLKAVKADYLPATGDFRVARK